MQDGGHEIIDLKRFDVYPLANSSAPGIEYTFFLMDSLALVEALPEVFAANVEMEGDATIGDQNQVLLGRSEGTAAIGVGGIDGFGQRLARLGMSFSSECLPQFFHFCGSGVGRQENIGIATAKSH